MSRLVRALGLMAGLAVVLAPACGGNGDTIGQYTLADSAIFTDAALDDTGIHIIRPDVSTGSYAGSGTPETGTPDGWRGSGPGSPETGAPDTGSGSGTGLADVTTCPATCTTDPQCQEACPAAPSGSQNCCDTATSSCFQSVTTTCPGSKHPHDSGSDVY